MSICKKTSVLTSIQRWVFTYQKTLEFVASASPPQCPPHVVLQSHCRPLDRCQSLLVPSPYISPTSCPAINPIASTIPTNKPAIPTPPRLLSY
ncbi:hypothetical protein L211DRAFT_279123 [Terfezia boudieri ATCC MYA-4762]|uniref:Uncharacterized protein n=1 Tax=Terfezia boudieri ATCC MYA-4762 TaxID=1051890 RepID=A0A3N4LYT4_9PEZI|nr:hypothetical protein L211DRAFT_279123 [Terfezia boudieri ATCC MYA-4762]